MILSIICYVYHAINLYNVSNTRLGCALRHVKILFFNKFLKKREKK